MKLKAATIEVLLFVGVTAVTAIKLAGLFIYRNSILPGWDTVPHFYLFRKFLALLGSGSISGYDVGQLGGSSLFHFYGPLPYFIGALIKFIGGEGMSDFFAWRLLLFLVVMLSAFAFWFFVRTFVHKSMGWISIVLSLFYIFYPQIFRGFGIGASAVLSGGLFTSSLGIIFSILFFAFLEKTRETGKMRYIVLSVLCFAAVPLSSPMITVFLAFLWVVYALSTRKKENWLFAQGTLFAYGCLIVLFFIVPLIVFGFFQSAKPQTIDAVPIPILTALVAPFISLLSQYKNTAVPFASVWNSFLFLASFIIFIFFIYGFMNAGKNEKHRTLRNIFLGIVFIQIFGSVIANIFPGITVHYYRSSPFVLLFYFAIALLGIYYLMYEKRPQFISLRRVYIGMSILVVSIVGWVIGLQFDRQTTFLSPLMNRNENISTAPYYFRLEDYPEYPIAKEVIDKMNGIKTQRIFVEGDLYQIRQLGSPHTIATSLNLNGKDTINGLLYESAHQSDFLIPLSHGISHNLLWGYADDSLIYDFDLITQFRENIDRLRLFGVDYLVVHSVDAIERLDLLLGDKVEEIARFGEEKRMVPPGFQYALLQYRMYRFKNPVPLVRQPEYPVGLFVDESFSGAKSFKAFAIEMFRRQGTYDMPVAFTKNISDVSQSELETFDYFIVSQKDMRNKEIVERLRKTQKPIVVYDRFDDRINFFVTSLKQKKEIAMATINAFKNDYINFTTNNNTPTPWIINLGNFPNWRSEKRTVFEVTPGQMLVVSSAPESVSLEFKSSTIEKITKILSLIALFLLPFFALFLRKMFLSDSILNTKWNNFKRKFLKDVRRLLFRK